MRKRPLVLKFGSKPGLNLHGLSTDIQISFKSKNVTIFNDSGVVVLLEQPEIGMFSQTYKISQRLKLA